MSIPDVVSQSLGDLGALSLSASKRYLLKAFKGYVWWHHIYQGGPPCFASMTKEEFDSFMWSHHWDPKRLFGVYIEEPEEPQPQETPLTDFERSALQNPFLFQRNLQDILCDRGQLKESL